MIKVARVLFLLLLINGFTGCASDDIPLDSATCANGETRCATHVVERCQSGKWRAWSDCAASGLTCAPIDGVAKCLSPYGLTSDTDSESETLVDTMSAVDTDSTVDSSSDVPMDTTLDTTTEVTAVSTEDSATNPDGTDATILDSDTPTGDDTVDDNADTATVIADSDSAHIDSDSVIDTISDDTNTEDSAAGIDTGSDTATDDTVTPDTSVGDTATDGVSTDDTETVDADTTDTALPEPTCLAGGACAAVCGDGILVNEDCDDGNLEDGDGCSSDCTIENGYTCTTACVENTCTIAFRAEYRDLQGTHPDVEIPGSICSGGHMPGAVESTLDRTGKPVVVEAVAGGCISHFNDWYGGTPDKVDELILFEMSRRPGAFVNRYTENGDRWEVVSSGAMPPFQTTTYYNGTPTFFPVDELDTENAAPAAIPPIYGGSDDWSLFERDFVPTAPDHNFYFTSELTYWFEHQTANNATLQIMGDDDLWVFINGQLVLDFGGTHVPMPDWDGTDGMVVLDTDMSDTLGLLDGEVYTIRIFHAERKQTSSTFQLQLDDFQSVKSTCSK
ncbi:MAG: fibro-slime domain-containing protein [Deltaproteobacteria bacterium]|nr:fibro-slime domain-containing protein [Deltaproteobacteria bacterium]